MKVMPSAVFASAIRRSVLSAPRWLRSVTPPRRGTMAERTGINGGSSIVARMKPIHTEATANGIVSPAIKASMQAGADNVRRRLSNIFQRPIAGMASRTRSAPPIGPWPTSHGSNCQSPRAQRWWRTASTS